jgi:hypothetical protein
MTLRRYTYHAKRALASLLTLAQVLAPSPALAAGADRSFYPGARDEWRGEAEAYSPDRLTEREARQESFLRSRRRFTERGGESDPVPLSKYFIHRNMAEAMENQRRSSSRLLAAAGYSFRSHADGSRAWSKNGRVHRIEGEIAQDATGKAYRRDVLDMLYDDVGRLVSYRTVSYDEDGPREVTHWRGAYRGKGDEGRLSTYEETRWDALGNMSRTERSDIFWDEAAGTVTGYREVDTDPYGNASERVVSRIEYDDAGNTLCYEEESLEPDGRRTHRTWGGAVYVRDAEGASRLASYREETTEPSGRRTTMLWGDARYDGDGRLLSYTEKASLQDGSWQERRWHDARYADGRLAAFREEVLESGLRVSRRAWSDAEYDPRGRLAAFRETTESGGTVTWRRRERIVHNARNEVISYAETASDGRGRSETVLWEAMGHDRGRVTAYREVSQAGAGERVREWSGSYDQGGRLNAFREVMDEPGEGRRTRSQHSIAYDPDGRMVSFVEDSTDAFGNVRSRAWVAREFDGRDQVTAYTEVESPSSGRPVGRDWRDGVYDAWGRLDSYTETLTVEGRATRRAWRATAYDDAGRLVGFEETERGPLGDETRRVWKDATFDADGQLAGFREEITDARGGVTRHVWAARSFDAHGRVTASEESWAGPVGRRALSWSGRFDEAGRPVETRERVRDGTGLEVERTREVSAFDARGRPTDFLETERRSDMSEATILTQVSGRAYDRDGDVVDGEELTRRFGPTPDGPVDRTTRTRFNGVTLADGRWTSLERASETWESAGEYAAIEERTRLERTADGEGETAFRRVTDGAGTIVLEETVLKERSCVVRDLRGRVLSARESERREGADRIEVERRFVHDALGQVVHSTERTEENGRTVAWRETEGFTYDAAGRRISSRERTVQAGAPAVTETVERTTLTYDRLDRAVETLERSRQTGPGLDRSGEVRRKFAFDAAGRTAFLREEGVQDGTPVSRATNYRAFDHRGRPVAWTESSPDRRVEKSEVVYDGRGRLVSFRESGWTDGAYRDFARRVEEFDEWGRERRVVEEGTGPEGAYRRTQDDLRYDELGRLDSLVERLRSAAVGESVVRRDGMVYDAGGRLARYRQTRLAEGRTTDSEWTSLGYDGRGRTVGYRETGRVRGEDDATEEFATEWRAAVYDSRDRLVAYTQTTERRFPDGGWSVIAVDWTDGRYDERGRLKGFRERTRTAAVEAGRERVAVVDRLREDTRYWGDEAVAPAQGRVEGYSEVVADSMRPDEVSFTTVRDTGYDAEGRPSGEETATRRIGRLAAAAAALSQALDIWGLDTAAAWRRAVFLTDLEDGLVRKAADVLIATPAGRLLSGFASLADLAAAGVGPAFSTGRTLTTAPLPIDDLLLPPVSATAVSPMTVARRSDVRYDESGRATAWTEETRAGAERQAETARVSVTYQGLSSSRLAAYEAVSERGDVVSRMFRDRYEYDVRGRVTAYREASFEGETLVVDGNDVSWTSLSAAWRADLLNDVFEGGAEVLGRVVFENHRPSYDASGNVTVDAGERITRGSVRTAFSDADLFPQALSTQREAAEQALRAEADSALGGLRERLVAAEEEVRLARGDLSAARKAYDDTAAALAAAEAEETRRQDDVRRQSEVVAELDARSHDYMGRITHNFETQQYRGGGAGMERTFDRIRLDKDGTVVEERGVVDRRAVVSGSGRQQVTTFVSVYRVERSETLGRLGETPDGELARTLAAALPHARTPAAAELVALLVERERAGTELESRRDALKNAANTVVESGIGQALNDLRAADGALSAAVAALNETRAVVAVEARDIERRRDEETVRALESIREAAETSAVALAGLDLDIDGRTFRLDVGQALTLLDGGSVSLSGADYARDDLAADATVKTSLNDRESFLRLDAADPSRAVEVAWRGDARVGGQPPSSGLVPPPEGAGRLEAWLASVELIGDGSVTAFRVSSQTSDVAGRVVARTREVAEVAREGGTVSRRSYIEDTSGFRYDEAGRAVAYIRTTREGERTSREELQAAEYDGAGRLLASRTRVTETSGGVEESYELHLRNLLFDQAGRAVRSERVRIKDGAVSLTRDEGDARFDAHGRPVFGLSRSLQLSTERWDAAGGREEAFRGEGALGAVWTSAFDGRGNALRQTRLTVDTAPDGVRTLLEAVTNTYDARGHMTASLTDAHESVSASAAPLLRTWTEETTVLAQDPAGRVLRQRRRHVEGGVKSLTEDIEDSVYDARGRLVQSRTRAVGDDGRSVETLWRAVAFDAAGRAVRTDRLTREDGLTIRETSLSDDVYAERGRLIRQETRVERSDGASIESEDVRQEFLEHDASGRATRVRTVTSSVTDGALSRADRQEKIFRYDLAGRVAETRSEGIESIAGRDEAYSSLSRVFSFDAQGRAARSRTVSTRDGVTVVSLSEADVRYDERGRVVESRDTVVRTDAGGTTVTHETLAGASYDLWGRRIAYERSVRDGAFLTAERVSDIVYDAWGRIIAMTTDLTESSLNSALVFFRETTVRLEGARYDAFGNMTSYVKTVRDGDLVTRHEPALLAYDERGRLLESVVRVTDNAGRDEYEVAFGNRYDAAGRLTDGFQGTLATRDGKVADRTMLDTLSRSAGGGSRRAQAARDALGAAGLTRLSLSRSSDAEYDGRGRRTRWLSLQRSLAWDDQGRMIEDKSSRSESTVRAFDTLGRPSRLDSTVEENGERRTLRSTPLYDDRGRSAGQRDLVDVEGVNGDGTTYRKHYAQDRAVSYDGLGRDAAESVRTYHDSSAPFADVTVTVDAIRYGDRGQRFGWTETTVSAASPGVKTVNLYARATYDNAARLAGADLDSYEERGGRRTWRYSDRNVQNSYDLSGRLLSSEANRAWGAAHRPTGVGTMVASAASGDAEGPGGGGVQGLDDDWTAGQAHVTTTYAYGTASGSVSAVKVVAEGRGVHANKAVEAQGIRLTYEQKEIRYDAAGRTTGYRQVSTQVEYYEYQKSVRKGLRKKTTGGSRVEAVTTDSIVRVTAFDGHGRQVRTASASSRSDYNRTVSYTETTVRAFDDAGRATRVERYSESKRHLGQGTSASGGAFVVETIAYDDAGNVDRSRTHTETLSQWQSSTDRSTFTKAMKVADIAVAVAGVVITVLTAGAAAPAVALMTAHYQAARQGISINDFEAHHDRAQAHDSRMLVANTMAQVATSNAAFGAANFAPTAFAAGAINVTVSVGVAAAGGADRRTLVQVAALSAVSSYLQDRVAAGASSGAQKGMSRGTQALIAGGGTLVGQVGMTYGSPNQQTIWMVLGSAVSASVGGTAPAAAGVVKTAFLQLYTKNNSAEGGTEQDRRRRGLVLSAFGEVVGSAVAMMSGRVSGFRPDVSVTDEREGGEEGRSFLSPALDLLPFSDLAQRVDSAVASILMEEHQTEIQAARNEFEFAVAGTLASIQEQYHQAVDIQRGLQEGLNKTGAAGWIIKQFQKDQMVFAEKMTVALGTELAAFRGWKSNLQQVQKLIRTENWKEARQLYNMGREEYEVERCQAGGRKLEALEVLVRSAFKDAKPNGREAQFLSSLGSEITKAKSILQHGQPAAETPNPLFVAWEKLTSGDVQGTASALSQWLAPGAPGGDLLGWAVSAMKSFGNNVLSLPTELATGFGWPEKAGPVFDTKGAVATDRQRGLGKALDLIDKGIATLKQNGPLSDRFFRINVALGGANHLLNSRDIDGSFHHLIKLQRAGSDLGAIGASQLADLRAETAEVIKDLLNLNTASPEVLQASLERLALVTQGAAPVVAASDLLTAQFVSQSSWSGRLGRFALGSDSLDTGTEAVAKGLLLVGRTDSLDLAKELADGHRTRTELGHEAIIISVEGALVFPSAMSSASRIGRKVTWEGVKGVLKMEAKDAFKAADEFLLTQAATPGFINRWAGEAGRDIFGTLISPKRLATEATLGSGLGVAFKAAEKGREFTMYDVLDGAGEGLKWTFLGKLAPPIHALGSPGRALGRWAAKHNVLGISEAAMEKGLFGLEIKLRDRAAAVGLQGVEMGASMAAMTAIDAVANKGAGLALDNGFGNQMSDRTKKRITEVVSLMAGIGAGKFFRSMTPTLTEEVVHARRTGQTDPIKVKANQMSDASVLTEAAQQGKLAQLPDLDVTFQSSLEIDRNLINNVGLERRAVEQKKHADELGARIEGMKTEKARIEEKIDQNNVLDAKLLQEKTRLRQEFLVAIDNEKSAKENLYELLGETVPQKRSQIGSEENRIKPREARGALQVEPGDHPTIGATRGGPAGASGGQPEKYGISGAIFEAQRPGERRIGPNEAGGIHLDSEIAGKAEVKRGGVEVKRGGVEVKRGGVEVDRTASLRLQKTEERISGIDDQRAGLRAETKELKGAGRSLNESVKEAESLRQRRLDGAGADKELLRERLARNQDADGAVVVHYSGREEGQDFGTLGKSGVDRIGAAMRRVGEAAFEDGARVDVLSGGGEQLLLTGRAFSIAVPDRTSVLVKYNVLDVSGSFGKLTLEGIKLKKPGVMEVTGLNLDQVSKRVESLLNIAHNWSHVSGPRKRVDGRSLRNQIEKASLGGWRSRTAGVLEGTGRAVLGVFNKFTAKSAKEIVTRSGARLFGDEPKNNVFLGSFEKILEDVFRRGAAQRPRNITPNLMGAFDRD